MKKPLIGITPLYDYNLSSWWIVPGYMEGVMAAGGSPVMMPFCSDREAAAELISRLDGIIFTGGPDVNPSIYGEECRMELGLLAPKRDVNEKLIYDISADMDKPALGICRGHQLINAIEGGTLYQDLPSQNPSDTRHSQRDPNYVMTHQVEIASDSPMASWMDGRTELSVNSFHHQAIKKLAPTLKPQAVSKVDGLIESFYHPGRKFCIGVQWHPELAYKETPEHLNIFKALVEASR